MKSTGRLIPLLALLLMTGCTTLKRESASPHETFPSLEQAVQVVQPLGPLGKERAETVNISPKLSPKSAHENTEDFFEVVTVDGTAGESFSIHANGVCQCFGMPKWVVNPRIFLFDDAGQLVGESPIDPELGPLHAMLEGTFPATGRYRLVLLAESEHHRKRTGAIPTYHNGAYLMDIPYTIRDIGKIMVRFQ